MNLRIRGIGLLGLSLLAILVGVIGGIGAVFFRALIALIHNVAFLGQVSITFDANQFTPPGPWGPFIILVPAIGGLLVVFLVENFAPEARGHGVPEVLDAIYYKYLCNAAEFIKKTSRRTSYTRRRSGSYNSSG